MKKIFLAVAAMAMLATACTKDDAVSGGNESLVSFTIDSPELQTRVTDGKGESITHLQYAFYNEDGILAEISKVGEDAIAFTGKTTIQVPLVEGRTYSAIFWADNEAAPYTVAFDEDDVNESTMTISNTAWTANSDIYDAFYKFEGNIKPEKKTHKIELTRPFAQINIATADTEKAKNAGVVVEASNMVAYKAYTTLNLVDGEVSGKAEFTYSWAAIPTDPAQVTVGGQSFDMLAMNYVLVNGRELMEKVTLGVSEVLAGSAPLTREYTTVPVKRNYRTFIVGNLLTASNDFIVETKPGFDGEEEYEFATSVNGVTYATVQEAVDAATDGAVIDVAPGIHNEIVKVTGAKNITLRAAGEGVVLAGLDHQSNGPASSTVKVEGITIDNSIVVTRTTEGGWFTGTSPEIAPCVGLWGGHFTFNNCKFIVAGTSGRETGIMTWWTGAHLATLAFNNCEFVGKDDHANARAMQIYGNVNMNVNNCTFTTAKDYSLKYVASEGNVATFEGNKVYNSENFVELGSSAYAGKNYTVNINNTTYGDGVNSHVVANEEGQTVVVDGATYVRSSEAFAAAVTSDAEEISIVLGANLDVPISSLGTITGGSGEYKLGGENTQKITIDLGGKKLNITTTYWSNLGAKNNNATFTIKNGTMTSSQATGTWNSYDVTFSNCDYVIENVVFEKAIAFDNTGKSVVLNDVTINETHDYYAMWICAAGQTVTIDGLTVNSAGRGIKIDEQYVGTPAKVTLNVANANFTTAKKAAIMVKSVAGAEITASNLNIANVAADTEFAVWVDEDAKAHADKVVVNGAYSKVEGVSAAVIEANSNETLADEIKNSNAAVVVVKLAAGDYIVPNATKGKTVTFIGTGNPEDVKVAVTKVGVGGENCDYGLDGSNATFENITITTNSSTYIGYARCNGTYKNCVINGTYTLYGDSVFEDCTFNVSGDVYNIWTWGAPTATFTNCTFNCDGKAMLLYGQANTKLTMNDCKFNDNGTISGKAAIEIGNDYNKSYVLTVNNATVNGFDENPNGIATGSTLWANKNSMGSDKLNVVIDGVDVY